MAYNYKKKPFAVADSDSSDDEDLFAMQTPIYKKQKLAPIQPRKEVKNEPQSGISSSKTTAAVICPSRSIVKTDVSVDDIEIVDMIGSSYDSSISKLSEEETLLLDSIKEDDAVVEAREALAKLRRKKNTVSVTNYNSAVAAEVIPLRSSAATAPKIKTAAERMLDKVNRVQVMMDESKSALSSSSSSSTSTSAAANKIAPADQLKLKTRLNAKHEYVWKVSQRYTVKQFKMLFRQVYGLEEAEKVAMEYDGEKLSDGSTLGEDCDLQEDDLVDVKIRKEIQADAVGHAESFRKEGRIPSFDNPPAVSIAAATSKASTASVVVKTERANVAASSSAPSLADVVNICVEFPIEYFPNQVKRTQIKVRTTFALSILVNVCAKPVKANCDPSYLMLSSTKLPGDELDRTKTVGELGLADGCILYALRK